MIQLTNGLNKIAHILREIEKNNSVTFLVNEIGKDKLDVKTIYEEECISDIVKALKKRRNRLITQINAEVLGENEVEND